MPNTVVFLWTTGAALHAAPFLPGVAGRSPGSASLHAALGPSVAGRSPGSGSAVEEVPARALADLRDLGAARGLTFVGVSAARPPGLPGNDAALVDALEAELEQARTALSALEETNASARLHKIESDLLAHPHLPQASFLMAECLALQAQAARDQNAALAGELDARRFALEGPRAAAFGESLVAPPPPPRVTLDVRGLGEQDELELDGVRVALGVPRVTLVPGLHHARVWRADRLVFATFLQVAPEQTICTLDVPPLASCSVEDLERVPRAADDERSGVPAGIACERWARVRDEGSGIAISMCSRSQCGPFLHWQQRAMVPFTPITVEKSGFPAWAGFALAGASALVASSVILWQAGAFERGRPAAANWQFGGLNPQGLRF